MTTTIEHVPLTDEESNALVRQCHDGQAARELLDSGERMDAATERWLRREIGAGEQAVERLIRGHARLVESLARERLRTSPAHVELDDLVQAGYEAMLRCLPRADGRRPFHSFARAFIRRACADAASARMGETSWDRRMSTYIGRAREHLAEKLHREPTTREITARVNAVEGEARRYGGFELSTISRHIEMQKRPAAVDTLEFEPDPVDDFERLFEDPDPYGLREDVARLPEPVAAVIRLRFGLSGEEPLTPTKTARRLALTVPRVSRLTEEGLATLRKLQLGEYVPPSDLREDLDTEAVDLADVVVALPDPDDIEMALAAA